VVKVYSVVAAAEGPYLVTGDAYGATAVAAFDTQGAVRWNRRLEGTIASDGRGGLYVGTRAYLEVRGTVTTRLEQLDASGAVVRSRTLKTTATRNYFDTLLEIDQIAATADGGAMVVGQFHGDSLDFGDFMLPAKDGSSFVAAFDASGATLWAH